MLSMCLLDTAAAEVEAESMWGEHDGIVVSNEGSEEVSYGYREDRVVRALSEVQGVTKGALSFGSCR